MTDPIKSKIQELCPDVMECDGFEELPITLAVVLRTIQKSKVDEYTQHEAVSGLCWGDKLIGFKGWNLEKDSWDSQSAETQAFVGSLLGL